MTSRAVADAEMQQCEEGEKKKGMDGDLGVGRGG